MCRSIKPLFNYDPPATFNEINSASLQYVRKISGFRKPSKANQAAFDSAALEIAHITKRLIDSLVTTAPPKNRALEMEKARAKARDRFGDVAT